MGVLTAPIRRRAPVALDAPPAPVLEVLQPQDGGVAAHVLQLAVGLRARGWEIEVATPASSAIIGPLVDAGVPVHELSMEREPGRGDLATIRELRALDRRRGYGLVHAHSSKAGALIRAALPRRRRLLYTPHCFAFAAQFGGAQRLVYRAIEQAALPRTGALVAVCEWERREAERLHGSGGRVRQIEYGVTPCLGAAPDPELMMFKGDRPLAGMVSVLRPQKDPKLLVRAAARLLERGELPGRVAIVGNGPIEHEVRDEIDRLGVAPEVAWFPYRGAVDPYLAALDLFVLPSAWEALPLSLLEAMSCGLPIVATSVGGTPEAVEDGLTGRVVDPGDEAALAEALRGVMSNATLREAMGAAGRARYEARFRLDRMVEDTAALYSELLGVAPEPTVALAKGNGRLRLT
ncbi:MAG TPA: glycosyltransferase [Thermoleophilaceae bacterium]|nr:glycosyltransferase [Thermoleophilaceae bacterium]